MLKPTHTRYHISCHQHLLFVALVISFITLYAYVSATGLVTTPTKWLNSVSRPKAGSAFEEAPQFSDHYQGHYGYEPITDADFCREKVVAVGLHKMRYISPFRHSHVTFSC
jgi:hypothetical protein